MGDPVRSATGAVSHDHNESALRHTGCEGSFESGSPGSETLCRSPTRVMSGAGLELHDAASTGDYDALEEFVKTGKYDVNLKDIDASNRTALHWACQKGYAECIRLLLEHGAKGTARTTMGWTPAHCAAESNRIPALRALHAAHVPIDLKDKHGDTPRRIATIYGHHDCVKYLLQAEAELAERRRKSGMIDEDDGDEYSDDDKDTS